MDKKLGHWIAALTGVAVLNPVLAQSLPPQPIALQWADLGLNGVPTGTFISTPQLTTEGIGDTQHQIFIYPGQDGVVSIGDRFELVGTWPGLLNGPPLPLAGDYVFVSTLEGTVSGITAGLDNIVNSSGDTFDVAINGGEINLSNIQTGGLIASLPVQNGTAVDLNIFDPNSTGTVTVDALLGPGCISCDSFIRMVDGSSVSDRSITTTVSGSVSIDDRAPTNERLELFVTNNGTSSTFAVADTVPPPPQIPWTVFLTADNILEGSNGNPMRTLLAPGQSSVGAVGSGGRNDHQGINGNLGNGQIRFAHNFGFAQFNMSGGGLWAGNNDTFRGDTNLRGAYVVPEVITKMPGTTIHVTATGLYSPGEVNPDVSTLGGRLRADWLDAFKILKTGFTPYASYTYIHTGIEGFMDKSTPFSWDHHSDEVNTARYGADAVIEVTARINFLARIEGAHRFEAQSNNVTGRDVNGASYSFPGLPYKQDWVRGAVGIEGKLGKNFFGVLLNATSQGPVTSYWATAHYRAAF